MFIPSPEILRDIARTPLLNMIQIEGDVPDPNDASEWISYKQPFKPEQILDDLQLPIGLKLRQVEIVGQFPVGVHPTKESAVEDINRMRKDRGLGLLPPDFVVVRIEPILLHPGYRLRAAVL